MRSRADGDGDEKPEHNSDRPSKDTERSTAIRPRPGLRPSQREYQYRRTRPLSGRPELRSEGSEVRGKTPEAQNSVSRTRKGLSKPKVSIDNKMNDTGSIDLEPTDSKPKLFMTRRSKEQLKRRERAQTSLHFGKLSGSNPQLPRSDERPDRSNSCDSRSHDHPSLTIHIVSYSKASGEPCVNIPTFNIDAHNFAVPNREMRESFTGRDPEFANTLFNTANNEALYQDILNEVKSTIRAWRLEAKPPEEIALLVKCKAGMHRSVAVAERLAKDMREWHGPGVDSIRCLHIDLGKNWLNQNWRSTKREQPANP